MTRRGVRLLIVLHVVESVVSLQANFGDSVPHVGAGGEGFGRVVGQVHALW